MGCARDGRAVRDAATRAAARSRARRGLLLDASVAAGSHRQLCRREVAASDRRPSRQRAVSTMQGAVAELPPPRQTRKVAGCQTNPQSKMPNRLAAEQSPVSPPAQGQPGGLVPVGRRGVRARPRRGQADLPVDRLLDVPLVPRDGARELREPAGRRGAQRALRLDQGRSRGAARRRPRLHDVRPGDDRLRRLADERVADAGARAVLRRHLLPADVAVGAARLRRDPDRRSRASGARSDRKVARSRPRPIVDRLSSARRSRPAGRRCPGPDVLDARCGEFAAVIRRAARRLRRGAEVSAAERAAVPAARARAHRRCRVRATWC